MKTNQIYSITDCSLWKEMQKTWVIYLHLHLNQYSFITQHYLLDLDLLIDLAPCVTFPWFQKFSFMDVLRKQSVECCESVSFFIPQILLRKKSRCGACFLPFIRSTVKHTFNMRRGRQSLSCFTTSNLFL